MRRTGTLVQPERRPACTVCTGDWGVPIPRTEAARGERVMQDVAESRGSQHTAGGGDATAVNLERMLPHWVLCCGWMMCVNTEKQ